jgi:hypothetical protein
MLKIQAIFQKMLALYITLLYFAWSLMKGVEAIISDPKLLKSQALVEKGMNFIQNPPNSKIGKTLKKAFSKETIKKTFCFEGCSLILTENGRIPIKFIKIGDILKGGIVVLGVISTYSKMPVSVFLMDDVLVTGDHLYYDDNIWERVELKRKSSIYHTRELYCLVTSNNIIPTSSYFFADYQETSDKNTLCIISKKILKTLEPRQSIYLNPEFELGERTNCLAPKTLVRTKEGGFKPIDSFSIGDFTSKGRVLGIYNCDMLNMSWIDVRSIILGPSIIIRETNVMPQSWNKAYNIGQLVTSAVSRGIHLITEHGSLELLHGIEIRDFSETDDAETIDYIDDLVLNSKNKIKKSWV